MGEPSSNYSKAEEAKFLYYWYARVRPDLDPKLDMKSKLADGKARYDTAVIGSKHLHRVQQDKRIVGYQPTGYQDLLAAAPYQGHTVPGVGVRMGAYTIAEATGHTPPAVPLIATDHLVDCVALVLTAQDPANPHHKVTALAHIDVVTDALREVPKLLKRLPANFPVTATLLGGPLNENYYTEMDILHALTASKQVKQIRMNTMDATTVLVDVASGHVFMSTKNPIKKGDDYNIAPHTFPITTNITFYEYQRNTYPSVRDVEWEMLQDRTSPRAPFVRNAALFELKVKGNRLETLEPTLQSAVNDIAAQGALTHGKLDALSKQLAREIGLPVHMKYDASHQSIQVIADGHFAANVYPPIPTPIVDTIVVRAKPKATR